MIRYALRCRDGHTFEAWFRDSVAFDALAAAGEVSCAVCGSTDVTKSLMAPSLGGADLRGGNADGTPAEQDTGTDSAGHTLAGDDKAKALAEAVRKLRRHVIENAEYVGPRFAEEARRIHHDEEKRSIYGEAEREEVKALVEEGIEIHPLPRLPEDQN